jgi:hypothetical protein
VKKYSKYLSFIFLFAILLAPLTAYAADSGCGVLGGTDGNTAKLLAWGIKLIRLGIPILIIILGVTDFLRILFSGEDKVYKEAFARFAKRVAIGVSVIFIPYILYFLIRISGVDMQYSIDNLYCGILETTSGVKGTTNEDATQKSCIDYSASECPTTAENGNSCKVMYDNWDTSHQYGYCASSTSSSTTTTTQKSCVDYSASECPATAENGKSCTVMYDNWNTKHEYGYCATK